MSAYVYIRLTNIIKMCVHIQYMASCLVSTLVVYLSSLLLTENPVSLSAHTLDVLNPPQPRHSSPSTWKLVSD